MIIMTSNIGVRQLKDFGDGIGFGTEAKKAEADSIAKSVIQKALKKTFSPEFLNRIDDVVIFNSLDKDHIHKIIDLALADVYKRIEVLGYQIELTNAAKDFLAEKGYDPQYGARPLHRAIQRYMEDPLAEEILNGNPKPGDLLYIDFDKKKEEIKITIKKPKKSEQKTDA